MARRPVRPVKTKQSPAIFLIVGSVLLIGLVVLITGPGSDRHHQPDGGERAATAGERTYDASPRDSGRARPPGEKTPRTSTREHDGEASSPLPTVARTASAGTEGGAARAAAERPAPGGSLESALAAAVDAEAETEAEATDTEEEGADGADDFDEILSGIRPRVGQKTGGRPAARADRRRHEARSEADDDPDAFDLSSLDRRRPSDGPGRPPAEGAPTREKPAEATEEPRGDRDVPAPNKLPPSGYAQKLRDSFPQKQSAGGVSARASVIADEFRYEMALGMEELKRAGYYGEELRKELRKLYSEHRSKKGRVRFYVKLTTGGEGTYFFLQKKLKQHIDFRQESKKSYTLTNEEPKPEFVKWQIYELRPNQARRIYHRPLARINNLEFELGTRLKQEKKDAVTLTISGIIAVRHIRAKDRVDGLEGIHLGQKQIQTSGWSNLVVSPLRFRFYPGRWEVPPPPSGFEDVLAWLDKNG